MARGAERASYAAVRAWWNSHRTPPVVLLALANDRAPGGRGLRNLAEERRAIQRELEGRAELVVLHDALLREVWDAFDDPRLRGRIAVFHFAGHASGSWLAFEDEGGAPVNAGADGLAGFLGRQQGLVLVFLNGCSTQAQVRKLREDVPAVIATSDAIDDAAAAELAGVFYAGLRNKPLEQAFDDAAAYMRTRSGGDPREVTRELELDEGDEERTTWPWELDCDDALKDWRLPRPGRWPAVVGTLAIAALGCGLWAWDSLEPEPFDEAVEATAPEVDAKAKAEVTPAGAQAPAEAKAEAMPEPEAGAKAEAIPEPEAPRTREPRSSEPPPSSPEVVPKTDPGPEDVIAAECAIDPSTCDEGMPTPRADAGDEHPSEPLPSAPSAAQVRTAMTPFEPKAKACGPSHGGGAGENVRIKLAASGSTGKVVAAVALDDHTGTALGRCVADALRGATLPKFGKPQMTFIYAVTL